MNASSDETLIREALHRCFEYWGTELDDVTGTLHAITPEAKAIEAAAAALDRLVAERTDAVHEMWNGKRVAAERQAVAERERDELQRKLDAGSLPRLERALRAERERDEAREALTLAIATIEGLAEQQAMEDNWYREPLARVRAALGLSDG